MVVMVTACGRSKEAGGRQNGGVSGFIRGLVINVYKFHLFLSEMHLGKYATRVYGRSS